MDQWIQNTLEQFGVMGVAFLMLIENIFPPIPSEVVMPWAGYSVSQGDHHGAWLTISPKDIDRVDRWFVSWGGWAVLICRLIPGLRTLISLPAGFSNMSFLPFAIYTAIGTVAWTALLASLGWWLGNNYADLTGPLGWVSTAVVVGLFAWWLFRLLSQKRWSENAANAR